MWRLEVDIILDINEIIRRMALNEPDIEYQEYDTYPIRHDKLEALVASAPCEDIIDTAAYYLKNIILLQPFSDANHRTALNSARLFLSENGRKVQYSSSKAQKFQRASYRKRYEIYGTYEQMGIEVLTETENEFFDLCRKFIENNLTEGD